LPSYPRVSDAVDRARCGSATLPFRIAFLLVAAVALIGVWDSMMLHATAGEHAPNRCAKDADRSVALGDSGYGT
jgi:hypothetical protein